MSGGPSISVSGTANTPLELKLSYQAESDDAQEVIGEIVFRNVFEYRWVSEMISYEEFVEHRGDGGLCLYEILNSRYVAKIAPNTYSPSEVSEDQVLVAGVIPVSHIRHFRIGFDDYGSFDVLAEDVLIRKASQDSRTD